MSQSSESSSFVIRFQSGSIHYPEICPVCGEVATSNGKIIHSCGLNGAVPRIDPIKRLTANDSKQLEVPCCQKHHYSATEMSKINSITGVLSGLIIFVTIFLSVYIVGSWLLLTTLPPQLYSLYLFLAIIFLLSFRSLGPSKLEKAISIVFFDHEAQTLILKIK
ncbi:MAG: hypothetical protein ACTSUB_07935, partial [Candidatus Thorarchaeota archaeon]